MCSHLQAFGAPFIVAHMDDGKKEAFFGSDRFELLADTIGIVMQFQALSFLAAECYQGHTGLL